MHETFNSKFGKKVMILHPGDFTSSREDILLCTVLGSCISVVLFDKRMTYAGMNHFMLPASSERRAHLTEESGKYGMFAMELLINDMVKKGSRREDLQAKVFGGGHVLNNKGETNSVVGRVPANNITFAFDYLESEKIPVIASDTGGNHGRKIYVYALSGKVLLKRLSQDKIVDVVVEEEKYSQTIYRPKSGGVVFF